MTYDQETGSQSPSPRFTNVFVNPSSYRSFMQTGKWPDKTGKAVAGCVECHTNHTAVERTFVQFYPTLLEVARRQGTVKPGF